MSYTIKIIFTSPEDPKKDILIAELSDIGFHGFEENGNDLIAYILKDKLEEDQLNDILNKLGVNSNREEIKETNWNAVWESNYPPVNIDEYCTIRASFHEAVSSFKHSILITPKMSFGTGHHATTMMMIRQMRKLELKNTSVLDLGTGTGVLSILAEKEGAVKILAIDNDPWSVENATENIMLNQCKNVEVILDDKVPKKKFDVILANINKNVITLNAVELKNALNVKGKLLLSGLLTSDEKEITSVFKKLDLQMCDRDESNGWICILLEA